MKKIIVLFFIIPFICISQTAKSLNNFELNFYGNEFELPSYINLDKTESLGSITKGKIISSCPKKGCWVKINVNSEEVFVSFKDYSFFVPKEGISGKNIIINGEVNIDTISVSQLKHYAYDAGESEDYISNIKYPKVTKSIIAEGLAIVD